MIEQKRTIRHRILAFLFLLGVMTSTLGIQAQEASADCVGSSKEVNSTEGTTKVKELYLNSCEATAWSADLANDANNQALMQALVGAIPGLQGFALSGALTAWLGNGQSNKVTKANRANEGVVITFEQDLSNKDTSGFYTFEDVRPQ